MGARWTGVVSAALLTAGTAAFGPAGAATLSGEISASVAGLPVAVAEFKAVVAGERYQVSGSGRTAGVGNLLSDGRASVASSGRISASTIQPAAYSHELVKKGDRDRVRIAFAGDRVRSVSIEPPLRPRRDRVPLGEEHVRHALDPLSAIMLLSAGAPGPELCNRTLPIFDGEMRYDLDLSFKRTDRVGGLAGPAYVCAIRYRPIAGHRPGRSAVQFLQRSDGMEIWLAAIGEGVVAPVRVRVPTPFGPLLLSATRLSLR
jgi:hypothetical protein